MHNQKCVGDSVAGLGSIFTCTRFLSLAATLVFVSLFSATTRAVELPTIDVDHVMSVAATKLAAHDAASTTKTNYPDECSLGSTTWSTASSWEVGFYPGCLWYMYEWTNDSVWRERAEVWQAGIEQYKTYTNKTDLGFMINNSFGHAYRLTGDERYKQVVLTAANSQSYRYLETVGSVKSWDWSSNPPYYDVNIDTMMNMELPLWASKNGGTYKTGTSEDLYNMAVSHADNTILNHVRADGSTYHVVRYDENTGDVVLKWTHQGMSTESTWSRGQSWAIYAYTVYFRETGDSRYLDTARKTADYFIDNLPADYVPLADFDSTYSGLGAKDSSAAAVTASALIELSTLETDLALKDKYWSAAVNILDSLTSSDYLSEGNESAGLLLHGSRNYRDYSPGGDNKSYIFGDYYFIEACMRYAAVVPEPGTWLMLLSAGLLTFLCRTGRRTAKG